MHSIRTKYTLLTICAVVIALSTSTLIGAASIKKLGNDDAEQMLSLMCTTGAMNLESYFESVERSTQTVASLVQRSLEDMPFDQLGSQVEQTRGLFGQTRGLFGQVAYNTNGVLTYYFRIDPAVSRDVKGYWYVNLDGNEFTEHEVTDITQYDTNDTSKLVWFTVPKATGKGVWLPLSNGMKLYVTVPMAEINRSWQKVIWNSLLGSAVVLVLASVAILLSTRRLKAAPRSLRGRQTGESRPPRIQGGLRRGR